MSFHHLKLRSIVIVPWVLCVTTSFGFANRSVATEPISFRSQVATVLFENCVACHGPKKAEGGYRIDSFDELKKAGDSGEAPVTDANIEASELLRRLTTTDESERMPADCEPLSNEQVTLISTWIAEGAKFDGNSSSESLLTVIPPKTYSDPPETYAQAVPITALAFSPDGSQLLASGYHEITIWNCADAKLVRRIKNLGQSIYAIKFLPDGKTLAIGCGEPGIRGEVRLIDFETGTLKNVAARSTDVVLDLAIRPQSQEPAPHEMAVAGADGLIRIVDYETFADVRTIASHADWVTAIAWSDDGTQLVSASRDKSVKVFNTNNGELLVSYQGHAAATRGVAFSADGKNILSAGSDNQIHRWAIEGAAKVAGVGIGGEAFKLVRGNAILLVPSTDNQLRTIDLNNNAVLKTLSGHRDWITSVSLNETTNLIASGSLDGEIRLWNAADGTLVQTWIAKP